MTEPIASVVRTATTPSQARVWAALLEAEGIPTRIDGDSLADEIAVSMRVMNRSGVQVLVPTGSLQRAREILEAASVDEGELERQALAAENPERAPTRRAPSEGLGLPWGSLVAVLAAIVFLGLWRSEVEAREASVDPYRRIEPLQSGYREYRAADGALVHEYFDDDGDRYLERIVTRRKDGTPTTAWDADRDLLFERVEDVRGELRYVWTGLDQGIGRCEVKDASGAVIQTLTVVDGKGFELTSGR